jgi:ketosteroid isomerase-like protein
MSRENVEVVRRLYYAFNHRRLDSAVELWDPEGEWIPAMAGAIETKVYRAADTGRYWDDLFESFSEVRVDDLELRDCGDRVLSLYTLTVRGHGSGIPIEQSGGAVFEVRDGKIVQGRSYLSQPEALKALGLEG